MYKKNQKVLGAENLHEAWPIPLKCQETFLGAVFWNSRNCHHKNSMPSLVDLCFKTNKKTDEEFIIVLDKLGELWRVWERFGRDWETLRKFGRVLDEFGRVWESLGEFGRVWESFGRVWESLGEFGRVWKSLREVWTSLGEFGRVWDKFGRVLER